MLENCIKHAVELTDESIKIISSVKIQNDKLEVVITNTSIKGIKESDNSLGEGIQNLRERLDYIYNGKYKLETGINSIGDYSVNITLPSKYEK